MRPGLSPPKLIEEVPPLATEEAPLGLLEEQSPILMVEVLLS